MSSSTRDCVILTATNTTKDIRPTANLEHVATAHKRCSLYFRVECVSWGHSAEVLRVIIVPVQIFVLLFG
jgi:hypothetical protein